ncbi:hypothetical protein E7Z59_09355 [Robertkochia marina]|uniref:Lipoprotein n=1 Tax=Robertkochia marina TaxID=1227945 RepID=A0A4V3UY63_9FLAO|nr:DUF6146 family protein [Robertkochia marina]THD67846.1 hypothetical protein E7Z59_09355 [Robertkochia marina]TRZ42115.1 hypothetical protein D3A96_12360 [Robertkochia marina]
MRMILTILVIAAIASCSGTKKMNELPLEDISRAEQEVFKAQEGDTVRIGNDSTEYEIIIIDPGFSVWVNRIAQPRGYYSQSFMENRNRIFVTNWNIRAQQPQLYDPNLYLWRIDYDPNIDYGYEVNYMLFNYFIYFQRKYNQRLGPFYPRIN